MLFTCPDLHGGSKVLFFVKSYQIEHYLSNYTRLVNVIFFSEYKESFKVEINRKSRAFARVIERKTAKFEIFHKR